MATTSSGDVASSYLGGVRVLEAADELGEYCGKVLAGMGADVVKVEPPSGELTRQIGPFYRDEVHRDRSLHFWHYNFGKRSAVLDLDEPDGQAQFRGLVEQADIVIDSRPTGWMEERRLGYSDLSAGNPALVYAKITPFGEEGPWAKLKGSDLVHLALGGVMMNCGYNPTPEGEYDTPPIAPQMWHSYHIAGEMTVFAILSALVYRFRTGKGQRLTTSVHRAVSASTETDVPNWTYLRQTHHRRTCRHSMPQMPNGSKTSKSALSMTKDGRWLQPYTTYLPGVMDPFPATVRLLEKFGMARDLTDPRYEDVEFRNDPAQVFHLTGVINEFTSSYLFSRDLWRDAQGEGLPWAPIRRPEENVGDNHWKARGTFFEVDHPDLDETFTYVGGKFLCEQSPWRRGPRPPLLGEHTNEVVAEWLGNRTPKPASTACSDRTIDERMSPHGKPFALSGARVIDLGWMLASAGAGRFLAAAGADVIKVEHETRWDGMRWGAAMAPEGGRTQRAGATEPLPISSPPGPNRSGAFMEINSGKRSLSLNLRTEEGRAILGELVRGADIIVEGFSPGTMERMGLGYRRLRELNPRVIYVQQSGFGQVGTYGRARAFGPTAQAFTGISEQSGLPEPFPPAGIGYSYLDWFGAYNLANAMVAALYRRDVTGEGCYIDSSQAETGLYLTGTAILDHSANGRRWSRYGNGSPYKKAAPHGAYPAAGNDRWVAIACFTDLQWEAACNVLQLPKSACMDERFATLEARMAFHRELDNIIAMATQRWDRYKLMFALQEAGVPSGVCQTAEDRCDGDPQLAHDEWRVELEQSTIGRWPVKEVPVHLSETPTYIGGRLNRSGPDYGEDTEDVLRDLLHYDDEGVERLQSRGVV